MNEILTPCILQSIIICSTIIILCVVAVSAFRIHKVENRKKELKMEDTENSSCLGSYIFLSSIVVLIAVVIFSYAFFSDKKVLDFMSLASALVSIILAVITIIYSFVINSQTAGQIDKLTKTSKSLQTASNKAVESANVMKSAAQQVVEASKSYEISAESLEKNIERIIQSIIREEFGRLLGAPTDYETVGDLQSVNNESNSRLNNFKEEVITKFNDGNSNAGAIILYLCSKVQETGVSCDLMSIFPEDTIMYYWGYIIALNAIGFTAIDVDFSTKTIKTANVIKDIKAGALKRIEAEVNNDFITENKQKIDEYFAVKE